MKKVIMGVGIPGSGKTTVLKEFASKNGYTYISPDDIRVEITGTAEDQSKNREVWQTAHQRLRESLELGDTVVFDATFTVASQRREFIEFARECGAHKVQAVVLDVELETAKERNAQRERVVPEHVLDRMQQGIDNEPATIADGFDLITTLDEEQKLITAERAKEGGEGSTLRRY